MEAVESLLIADRCEILVSNGLPSPLLPPTGTILPPG